jgi:hypothetical protein
MHLQLVFPLCFDLNLNLWVYLNLVLIFPGYLQYF